MSGSKITKVTLAENDRFITIEFQNQKKLLFQLFGNSPNVFLIENGKILDSFKNPDKWIDESEPKPRKPRQVSELNPDWSPKKTITKIDGKFPRQLIDPIINHYKLNEKTVGQTAEITKKLTHALENNPGFRILESGHLCLLPQGLLPLPNQEIFANCNDAVRYAYYKTSKERRLTTRFQSIRPKLEREIKKAKSTIAQLERADKALERSEKYEEYGHILMANAHEPVERGTEKITLTNFYDDNSPVEIKIKGDLSLAENAQRYYEKSTKAKTRVKESKRRLKTIKSDLEELEEVHQSFQNLEKIYEFDDWMDDHRDQLNELGVLSQNQQKEMLPFRRAEIDDYEIWIGKNAKSNDKLTTRAHKEDVWLHARGVAGSHVVIRMNNNKEMPPKSILMKTAAVAAWNSKARGTNLAPVIITKRKYVTKPKGAPAGAVRVQKEDVELVKPQKIKS
ncbi:MAG: NFACT RNA binding domain-containing protein [Balneolaceae bacterium]